MVNLTNKKVLITGAGSMLGKAITVSLVSRGIHPICIRHADADLTNWEQTSAVFSRFRPDYVFNCAGFNGSIRYNQLMPAKIYGDTTRIAINVMSAAAENHAKKVVNLLTSCAYPAVSDKLQEPMFLEGLPHDSVACHGHAKRATFIFGQQITKQFPTLCVGVVFNNCYGNEKFDSEKTKVCGGLIKKFVDARNNNLKEVTLWGTGKVYRELLFADDAGEGVVRVMEQYEDPYEVINVGTGVDMTITELAERIKEATQFKGTIIYDLSKPDGQMRKLLSVTKMQNMLAWYPPTSLREGLASTIKYYEENYANKK